MAEIPALRQMRQQLRNAGLKFVAHLASMLHLDGIVARSIDVWIVCATQPSGWSSGSPQADLAASLNRSFFVRSLAIGPGRFHSGHCEAWLGNLSRLVRHAGQ
jgi:hypothetical protein